MTKLGNFTLLVIIGSVALAGVNCDWSWGNKGKEQEVAKEEVKEVVPSEQTSSNAASTDTEQAARSLGIPDSVLPLEKHQNYAPEPTADGEVVRSARFLGISNKLCKIGVKGMCDGRQGYPPVVPSHYGNSVSSTYSNYGPPPPPVQNGGYAAPVQTIGYPTPVKTHTAKKPLKKVFDGLFKSKKSKGYAHPQDTFIAPSPGYSPPKPAYQVPSHTFNHPVYKAPAPTYHAPKPKPLYPPVNKYIQPSPLAPVHRPSYKQPSPHYHTPKPKDIVQPVYVPKVTTHIVSQGHPSKVHHIHTHTHVYKDGPQFGNKVIHHTFPRDDDDDDSSFLSSANLPKVKTAKSVNTHGSDSVFAAQNLNTNTFYDPFIPANPINTPNNFLSNQDKRHINANNNIGSTGFANTNVQKSFNNDINKLVNSFGNNAINQPKPVDCQCVPAQYCAPEDLVARNDPNNISHLLDARNDGSDILSNATFPEDYFDYDYIRSDSNDTVSTTTQNAEDEITTTILPDITETTSVVSDLNSAESTTQSARTRRDVEEVKKENVTSGLEGRQLNGFAPGLKGCGPGHVCCRRPVFVAAKRSQPVCGKGNPSIHGRVSTFEYEKGQSDFGEYPWQAAILREEGSDSMFVCGATLIDEINLLTAAHCVNDLKVESLKVRLGEWDVNRDTEFYKHIEVSVGAVFVHPEFYKGNLYNDIAVVKLSAPVNTAQYPHIAPVCLPPPNQDFSNFRCQVTGWGKDAFGNEGKFQHILKELEIPVVSPQVCQNALQTTRLGRDYKLHKGFICAGGEKGKDACKGDGGGPLVCSTPDKTFHLAGIVSWGIGCGEEGIPGVYVNIPYYVEWIKSITGF